MRYHHLGVPTHEPRDGERYLEAFGVYIVDYDRNPFGIEWMRYEPWSPVPGLVKTMPHLAFVVEDLNAALEGQTILIPPNAPSDGICVAFIVSDGAPVELMAFEDANDPRACTAFPK